MLPLCNKQQAVLSQAFLLKQMRMRTFSHSMNITFSFCTGSVCATCTLTAPLCSGTAELSGWRCRWAELKQRSDGHCRCRLRRTCWGGAPAPCGGSSSALARSSGTPAPPLADSRRYPSEAERPGAGCWGAPSPPPGPWSDASDPHTPSAIWITVRFSGLMESSRRLLEMLFLHKIQV